MNVGNSVRKAIDDWERGETDAAMSHACNAVDGTAKKVYPSLGSNARFTRLLRDNYAILGPLGMPGIGFELMPDARQPVRAGELRKTTVKVVRGAIRLSDRIIFGLIAVTVLSPANKDQHVPNGYYLTFGAEEKLIITEWWGRATDFPAIAAPEPVPSITLDFNEWMHEIDTG